MSYLLSAEQSELQDSLRAFFAENISSQYLRARMQAETDSDPVFLAKLKSLGLSELFSDDESGAGMRELGLLAFENGFALCTENIVEHLMLGPLLSRKNGADLSKILRDPDKSFSLARLYKDLSFSLQKKISATLEFVTGAKSAQYCFVLHEQGLALVELSQAGTQPQIIETLDRSLKRFNLNLKQVPFTAFGAEQAQLVRDYDSALKASELAGVAARAVQMTTEYAKTRKQFEQPIGTFQAVQQRLADMHLRAESMRSLADFACWAAAHSVEQLSMAASAALLYATRHAGWVVESAIQLHGGIGFTWEYDLHLYLRRAKTIEALYSEQRGVLEEELLRDAQSN